MSKVLPEAPAANPPSQDSRLAGLVRTARIRQWPKNLLVFAAPGAAGVLTHPGPLLRSLVAFAAFCAVASGTYFINDAVDAEADRAHPTKRRRPVAAGTVSRRLAVTVGSLLAAAGIGAGSALEWRLGLVLVIYVGIQIAYSLFLKRQPIFDLAAVAAGFVLRAIAGAVAVPVPISEWFLIVATFGSLLMVTGKRVAEQAELGPEQRRPPAHARRVQPDLLTHRPRHLGRRGDHRLLPVGVQLADRPDPPSRPHLVSAVDRADHDRPPPLHVPRRGRQGSQAGGTGVHATAPSRYWARCGCVLFAIGVYAS